MNPFFAIIVIGFVLFLMVFSGRSYDEQHEKEMRNGGDKLVNAIEDYNAKSQSTFGLPSTGSLPNNGGMFHPQQPTAHYVPFQQRNNQDNPYAAANPYIRSLEDQKQATPQGQAPQGQDEYYPPPPLPGTAPASPLQQQGVPHSQLGPQPEYRVPMTLPPQAHTAFVTPDGKQIRFAGTAAYTLNAKGEPMPLPDGKYKLVNGTVEIYVKNGKKILFHDGS